MLPLRGPQVLCFAAHLHKWGEVGMRRDLFSICLAEGRPRQLNTGPPAQPSLLLAFSFLSSCSPAFRKHTHKTGHLRLERLQAAAGVERCPLPCPAEALGSTQSSTLNTSQMAPAPTSTSQAPENTGATLLSVLLSKQAMSQGTQEAVPHPGLPLWRYMLQPYQGCRGGTVGLPPHWPPSNSWLPQALCTSSVPGVANPHAAFILFRSQIKCPLLWVIFPGHCS